MPPNMGALSESSYFSQMQESWVWGLDNWGHVLVKGKTWLQTILVPGESEQLQTVLPKPNFIKGSVISETGLQEMEAQHSHF